MHYPSIVQLRVLHKYCTLQSSYIMRTHSTVLGHKLQHDQPVAVAVAIAVAFSVPLGVSAAALASASLPFTAPAIAPPTMSIKSNVSRIHHYADVSGMLRLGRESVPQCPPGPDALAGHTDAKQWPDIENWERKEHRIVR
jgi:hypothetical protein